MRAARKRGGLTQMSVAQDLGISQSALSKMESARLIPSAPQWFSFCEITRISPDSLTLGYIERNQVATLLDDSEGGFKLPKTFNNSRGSKVRAVLPFVDYFRDALGEDKLAQYLESAKIDPDFFIDLDNQINLNFLLETLRTLIGKGEFKARDFSKMSKAVVEPKVHGGLYRIYQGAGDPFQRIKSLLGQARSYECNFRYAIEEQGKSSLTVSVTPEIHLTQFAYRNDAVLGNALCRYKQHYFEKISGCCGEEGPGLSIKEHECHYKGADRCVYEFKTAG
jgi:transcriptional regulator with XRE-family HTH domain